MSQPLGSSEASESEARRRYNRNIGLVAAGLSVVGAVVLLTSDPPRPIPSPRSARLPGPRARAAAPPPVESPTRGFVVQLSRTAPSVPAPATLSSASAPVRAPGGVGLRKEDVRAAIAAVLPRVRDCYQQGLAQDASLAGSILVELELEAREGKGRVLRGEVPDPETRSPLFEACVLQQVAGAEFPAPEGVGKVVVRYPFRFDPGGGFGGKE